MADSATHYRVFLAKHYCWMLGKAFEDAVTEQRISFVRIDQTCFDLRGGLALINLPLFQGTRGGDFWVTSTGSSMVSLLIC